MIQSSMFDILNQMLHKAKSNKSITDAITDINPTAGHVISGTFHFMEICEEEISKGMKKYPDKAEEIWKECFLLLRVPGILFEKGDSVYRSFCAEMIDRFYNKQDTNSPTKAETLCFIMEATWRSPLTRNASAAAYKLFKEVIGEIPGSEEIFKNDGMVFVEEYKGAADEMIAWAEKRYTRI